MAGDGRFGGKWQTKSSRADGRAPPPGHPLPAQTMEMLMPGSTIRYEEASLMTNVHSKLLERTFPQVMFVGYMAVTAPQQAKHRLAGKSALAKRRPCRTEGIRTRYAGHMFVFSSLAS